MCYMICHVRGYNEWISPVTLLMSLSIFCHVKLSLFQYCSYIDVHNIMDYAQEKNE